MKTSQLIAIAIRDALRAPRSIGVHMSPIGLSGEDVVAALRLVRKKLGAHHYLVGSAPDIDPIAEDRLFCAPDERAAEKATSWRNQVRVGEGERLVYLSVEEHGKASGLLDCLEAVTEDQLADALLLWIDEESGLPEGIADALRQGKIVEGAQIEDLCAFASAVEKDAQRSRKPWHVIGNHLPRLALARDTGLGGADTADRLRNNSKLVRALASGEGRRRSSEGALAQVESKLVAALTAGEDLREALERVDLAGVATDGIAPKGSKLRPREVPKPPKGKSPRKLPPGKNKDKPKPGSPGKGGEPSPPVTPKDGSPSPEDRSNPNKGGGGERAPADRGGVAPRPGPAPPPRNIQAPPLALGVDVLLSALLSGDGAPVEIKVRSDAREALSAALKHVDVRPVEIGAVKSELGAQFEAWRVAREQFIASVERARAQSTTAAAVLVAALPRLCADDRCSAKFKSFATATVELYRAAVDASERAMREVLALDTVAVRDADGVSVRMIGPLHLLWFGQTLERNRLLADAAALSDAARRALLSNSWTGPTSPAQFPEMVGEALALSRPEDGLIVFERVPETVERASLRELALLLLRRYLSLSPHASLGCRIAFEGRGAEHFIEGLAAYLAKEDAESSVELLCERPPALRDGSEALSMVEKGRIRLGALPLRPEELTQIRPHIAVRVPSGRPTPSETEPSSTAAQSNAPAVSVARTRFELRERSLRIVSSVKGVEHLEAFEALYAASLGMQATGTFVLDAAGLSLQGKVDVTRGASTTWHVLVAPSLGNRPPMNAFLLAHERVDDRAVCAVLSREVRVALRAVQDGLAKAGLNEEQPKVLKPIAAKLAQTCGGGLLSLRRDSVELLAGALLSLELSRRLEGRGALVSISERAFEGLTGGVLRDVTMQAAFGFANGVLKILVGIATLNPKIDLDLSLAQVGGTVGAQLHAVVSALQALRGSDLVAQSARDAVGWLVWPSLAGLEAKDRPTELMAALSNWPSVKDVQIEVHALLPSGVAIPKGKPPKVGRCPFSASAIDVGLIRRLLLSS